MGAFRYVFSDDDNSLLSQHEYQAYFLYFGNINRRNNWATWCWNNSSHHEVCDTSNNLSYQLSVFAITSCLRAEIVNYFFFIYCRVSRYLHYKADDLEQLNLNKKTEKRFIYWTASISTALTVLLTVILYFIWDDIYCA